MENKQKQFEDVYRELGLPKNCPGLNWRDHGNGFESDHDFDKEILPLLKAINKLPFCHTTGSCSGHSLRVIQTASRRDSNGWGIEIPYRITLTIHLKTDDDSIKKFIMIAQTFSRVSNGSFSCEIGWQLMNGYQDLNTVTESGYMPLEIQVFAHTKQKRDRLLEKYTKILEKKEYEKESEYF
jgi:hypothetical protein